MQDIVVVRAFRILLALMVLSLPATLFGQRPQDKPQPYAAPLLPADEAWAISLDGTPSAAGAMDDTRVYIPLLGVPADEERGSAAHPAALTAFNRETGVLEWITPIATSLPPVAVGDLVVVASGTEVHALSATTGRRQWMLPLAARIVGPMMASGHLLLLRLEPMALAAVDVVRQTTAWVHAIADAETVSMQTYRNHLYVTTPDGRVMCLALADGRVRWQRTFERGIGEPAVAADRVIAGSTANAVWAVDAESGAHRWKWERRIFGGDVLGADIENDVAYVASLDNMLRALNTGDGSQRWSKDIGTRPLLPPRVFSGTVVVIGFAPTLSTFLARTGEPVSTWAAPADAELEGPPLIDGNLKPFKVAMVVVMRDGRVVGMRPRAMLFAEPSLTKLTFLPGRPLPRESFDDAPEAERVAPLPTPSR